MARQETGGSVRLKGTLAHVSPGIRKCLRCSRMFGSMGPGHRICDRCRAKPVSVSRLEANAARDPKGGCQ
jgi:hypothetical protein